MRVYLDSCIIIYLTEGSADMRVYWFDDLDGDPRKIAEWVARWAVE